MALYAPPMASARAFTPISRKAAATVPLLDTLFTKLGCAHPFEYVQKTIRNTNATLLNIMILFYE
jgi:hypothetical protein